MPDPYKTSIIAQADSFDLTVLETVKQELGITDSESDAILLRYVREQSDAVARYCGREFAKETVVDSFDVGVGTCYPLLLSRVPVASISSIVEADTTLDQSGYDIDFTGGRVWRLDGSVHSWWQVGKIVVTYIGGHELLTTLPPGVERATVILIKQAWFDRTRDPRAKSETVEGVGSMSLWGGQASEYGPMPSEVAGLLRPYLTHYI